MKLPQISALNSFIGLPLSAIAAVVFGAAMAIAGVFVCAVCVVVAAICLLAWPVMPLLVRFAKARTERVKSEAQKHWRDMTENPDLQRNFREIEPEPAPSTRFDPTGVACPHGKLKGHCFVCDAFRL